MTELDAFVLGAGFGGLYQLKRLRDMGLKTRAFDKASGVGGVWHWNRYPGVMSDTESFAFRYSWDKEDLQTYPWSHHFVQGHEVLAYLQHIADKHDLRRDIQLNTTLQSAEWEASSSRWVLTTDKGVFTARYFISAIGLLSHPIYPNIPGIDTFRGVACHSSRWPEDLDCAGKRVGVIGSGSTGVQIITAIAPQVKSLLSFQRSPQYTVPSRNREVEPGYRERINDSYDDIFADMKQSLYCFGIPESETTYASKTEEERRAIFEAQWKQGSAMRFMFSGFSDLVVDREANEAACDFLRGKIAELVRDPVKARKLRPTEPYARRPLCDAGYYEQFNRENVDIIDAKATPIVAIVPEGIKTSDGTVHELDVIIFATGFDFIQGSYNQLTIRGPHETLKEHWARLGPASHMGITVAGFPNFFMLTGPLGPFTNSPPLIETHVDMNCVLIKAAEEARRARGQPALVEVRPESQQAWVEKCDKMAEGSIFREVKSWVFGGNVIGKGEAVWIYFGGMKNFLQEWETSIQGGFRDYKPFVEAHDVSSTMKEPITVATEITGV